MLAGSFESIATRYFYTSTKILHLINLHLQTAFQSFVTLKRLLYGANSEEGGDVSKCKGVVVAGGKRFK